MKQSWKPGTVLYPLPAVLVSCGAAPEEYNMLTVAWTGTVCSDPPMCFISVRPERHSHALIARTVKGKGVSFMEGDYGWHGKAPNAEQYEKARAELSARVAELEGK